MDTILLTDSCSDLPIEYLKTNEIPSLGLSFTFKGNDYIDDSWSTISCNQFYDALRNGEQSTTSQINTFRFVEEFKKYVSAGKSIIYIGFSSALSGTVNSAQVARDMIVEEYKDADISVIDSKSASAGQGALVYYACEMLKKGLSKNEIVDWLENNKLSMNHWFTVEDLNHLKRGGRVSGAAAFVGTILDIKPVLQVNDEGKLIPVTKVKGRKKSLRMLADKLKERIVNPEEQVIFISHGDCKEDALHLKELIIGDVNVKDVVISGIGPVIGSHAGPGTVALFFIGRNR